MVLLDADPLDLLTAADDALDYLAVLLARPGWQSDAACRERPDIDYVPTRGVDSRAALATCARCLVRRECLSYALPKADVIGIWGQTGTRTRARARAEGLTVDELLARVDRPKPAPTCSTWETAPCEACGGLLSRRDLAIGDGVCWGCRPALAAL
jgi:Transcription factor WhiB